MRSELERSRHGWSSNQDAELRRLSHVITEQQAALQDKEKQLEALRMELQQQLVAGVSNLDARERAVRDAENAVKEAEKRIKEQQVQLDRVYAKLHFANTMCMLLLAWLACFACSKQANGSNFQSPLGTVHALTGNGQTQGKSGSL